MTTRLKIGPADHGMPISLEAFTRADAVAGYHYELIDGRVYVSPRPELPEDCVESWLRKKLEDYGDSVTGGIRFVTGKARVFVPGRQRVTAPGPDLSAYLDFPFHRPIRELRWEDVSPALVVE